MATVQEPRQVVAMRGDPSYPDSDGKPLAENDLHLTVIFTLIETLRDRYAADPMAYVAGDMLLFYEPGNRRRHVAPDVFVALGVPKEPPRLHYLVWDEGKPPDVIFEITSKTTRREDQTKKLVLYRDTLRVPEYFLYDPDETYLRPSLQGYRLVGDEYVPIERVDGRLFSRVLGLHLARGPRALHLFDGATGRRLPSPRERAETERERAETERERADAAEEQAEADRRRADAMERLIDAVNLRVDAVERRSADLERIVEAVERRADASGRLAEAERERAGLERERAEFQRRRAETAEAEIERLRRELEESRKRPGG